MKKLAERITAWCNMSYPMEREQKIAVCYGLELLLENIVKIIGILLISVMFNMTDKVILFCLFFCPFRMLAGGIHMRTGTGCFIFMLALIGLGLLCEEFVPLAKSMRFCLTIFIIVICWKYAPCDTKKNPIIFESVREKKKYMSVAYCVACMMAVELLAAEKIKVLAVIALFLEAVTILPITDYINQNRFQKGVN